MIPQVSIYIPVRNRPELLAETLRAIQVQTFNDWECRVVDDASTDHTFAVIQSFQREDARIQGTRLNRPAGDAAASNTALGLLRGSYAARMDSDDLPLPTWLEAAMDFARHFKGVGFGCQAEWFGSVSDFNPGKSKETDPQRWQAWSLFNFEINHSGLIFHRAVQQRAGVMYRPITLNNDWDFVNRLSQHGAFSNLPSVQVHIRRHADNATRADRVIEDRDSTSVAIRRQRVERLVVHPSDEDMLLHCTAHPAPYWPFADQAYVWLHRDDYPERLNIWLQRLLAANLASGCPYPPAILRQVLLDELLQTATASWRNLPDSPPPQFRMSWLPG
ncbi:hypothetical protein TPL01_13810 [Sulfuriferula plumbiphila]|uniref:Glycosyltransferase 2-like domain-containing protein n=1 Tax=Sulfuriferula plumbiphila TaxID=171865 RepID=A0A512L6Y7_9PROT|nr:glycosyltransferase family A protein [Sulfuriferula plumbiphila]BBP02890.1 hypothetical protein SFPGR_03120 [Sulfuriferula plumbiphila]GEP30243.1 hypothetical protein TPL01_13810 [Sulfuriferula plumbiphila]